MCLNSECGKRGLFCSRGHSEKGKPRIRCNKCDRTIILEDALEHIGKEKIAEEVREIGAKLEPLVQKYKNKQQPKPDKESPHEMTGPSGSGKQNANGGKQGKPVEFDPEDETVQMLYEAVAKKIHQNYPHVEREVVDKTITAELEQNPEIMKMVEEKMGAMQKQMDELKKEVGGMKEMVEGAMEEIRSMMQDVRDGRDRGEDWREQEDGEWPSAKEGQKRKYSEVAKMTKVADKLLKEREPAKYSKLNAEQRKALFEQEHRAKRPKATAIGSTYIKCGRMMGFRYAEVRQVMRDYGIGTGIIELSFLGKSVIQIFYDKAEEESIISKLQQHGRIIEGFDPTAKPQFADPEHRCYAQAQREELMAIRLAKLLKRSAGNEAMEAAIMESAKTDKMREEIKAKAEEPQQERQMMAAPDPPSTEAPIQPIRGKTQNQNQTTTDTVMADAATTSAQ